MEKINAGIYSFFMGNISPEAVAAQRAVVDKFNKSKVPFYQIKTNTRHGFSLDAVWHMNGIKVRPEFNDMKADHKHDVIMFLDIDALPVNDQAIDSYIEQAYNGVLVGNVQRSNHIQNDQHLFVAPSAMAISVDTFLTIGKPSAIETSRADVAEEYTFKAEKKGEKVKFYMPLLGWAAPPEAPEGWNLKDGMPKYGRQTTFGLDGVETFWHNFQSFHPGQHEKFMEKCKSLIEDSNGKPQYIQYDSSPGHQTPG
jgi:hypothetical protein